MKNLKTISVIFAGILLLIITGSVVYYFVYALPSYNREKLEIERSKQEMEQRQQEEEKLRQAQREEDLETCLYQASVSYSDLWARNCADVADITRDGLNNCLDNAYLGEDFCYNQWKVDNSPECSLPSSRAENVNEYHDDLKEECYQKYGN